MSIPCGRVCHCGGAGWRRAARRPGPAGASCGASVSLGSTSQRPGRVGCPERPSGAKGNPAESAASTGAPPLSQTAAWVDAAPVRLGASPHQRMPFDLRPPASSRSRLLPLLLPLMLAMACDWCCTCNSSGNREALGDSGDLLPWTPKPLAAHCMPPGDHQHPYRVINPTPLAPQVPQTNAARLECAPVMNSACVSPSSSAMRQAATRQLLRAARQCARQSCTALLSSSAAPSPSSTFASAALRSSQAAAGRADLSRRLSTTAADRAAAAASTAEAAAEQQASTSYGAQQIQVGAAVEQ